MKWDEHVVVILSKQFRVAGMLFRRRDTFPRNVKLLIYNAPCSFQISYSNPVWGPAGTNNMKIKYHAYPATCTHTNFLFTKYDVLPLTNIYHYNLAVTYSNSNESSVNVLSTFTYLTPLFSAYHALQHYRWKSLTSRLAYKNEMLPNLSFSYEVCQISLKVMISIFLQ